MLTPRSDLDASFSIAGQQVLGVGTASGSQPGRHFKQLSLAVPADHWQTGGYEDPIGVAPSFLRSPPHDGDALSDAVGIVVVQIELVGMPTGESRGFERPRSTDQQAPTIPASFWMRVEAREPVVVPLVSLLGTVEISVHIAKCVGELRESNLSIWIFDSVVGVFVVVPARPEPESESASGDLIDGDRSLGVHRRVSESDRADQHYQFDPIRIPCEGRSLEK